MIMDQEQFAQPSSISTYSTPSYSKQPSPAALSSPNENDPPNPATSSFTNSLSDQNQDDLTAYFQKYGVERM